MVYPPEDVTHPSTNWARRGLTSSMRRTTLTTTPSRNGVMDLQLQLQSFTLKQLFSEESCSVVGLSEKMSFQLRSELSATVER